MIKQKYYKNNPTPIEICNEDYYVNLSNLTNDITIIKTENANLDYNGRDISIFTDEEFKNIMKLYEVCRRLGIDILRKKLRAAKKTNL